MRFFIFNYSGNRCGNKRKVLEESLRPFVLIISIFLAIGITYYVSGKETVCAASAARTGALEQGPVIPYEGIDYNTSENGYSFSSGLLKNKNSLNSASLNVSASTGDHYTYLSSDEKLLYSALYSAATNENYIPYSVSVSSLSASEREAYKQYYHSGSASLSSSYTKQEFNYMYNRVAEACYFDHPDMVEIFMCWPASYGSDETSGTYYDYIVFKAYYDDTKFETLNNQISIGLSERIAEINSEGLVGSNDAVTELNVHDYYVQTITYDNACASSSNYFNTSHTAWGSLYAGKAVCDGYSVGYEMIMDELGIDAMVIAGSGNGGGHAWNIIKLNNLWYEVDTTWALSSGDSTIYHSFFNRTTNEYTTGIGLTSTSTKYTHLRTEDYYYCGYLMPEATGTTYTYDYICENYSDEIIVYNYTAVTGITLSNSSLNLKAGESGTVTPTINPSNASRTGYSAISDNTAVATVSGTTVSAIAVGTANITYTSYDGQYSATCVVTVESEETSEETSNEEKTDEVATTTSATVSGVSYVVTGTDEVSVSDATTSKSTVTVPATIVIGDKTYKVTSISNSAFKNNKKITTVKGGKNITSIGANAFNGCKKLKVIKFSSSNVKTIGKKAFYGCKKLVRVDINGNKIKTIGKKAFSGVSSSTTIRIKASNINKFNKIVKKLKNKGAAKARFIRIK